MTTSPKEFSDSASNDSLLQNSIYIGMIIQNILYGVELILYLKTIRILLKNQGAHKKSSLLYALFSSILIFLITIWISTSAIFCQKMWLEYSDFPGGADIYWQQNLSVWYMDWGTTAVIILQLMTDGLMIYRCRIIWNSYRVIILPVFLWFSSLVLGVLVDWASSSPGGDFFTGVASQLALAYYSVSVFLNTLLTCMICYRIVRHGKRVREHLGKDYALTYFAIATLVVESVLPYSLSGIAFLVSLGVGSPTSATFVSVYILLMCISPQLLILRVIMGRAWDKDTFEQPGSTVKFNFSSTSESKWTDGSAANVSLQGSSRVYASDGHDKSVVSSA